MSTNPTPHKPKENEKYNLSYAWFSGNFVTNFIVKNDVVFSSKGLSYTEQEPQLVRALRSAARLLKSDKAIVSVNLDKFGVVSRGWICPHETQLEKG
jgi:hypothetical protein